MHQLTAGPVSIRGGRRAPAILIFAAALFVCAFVLGPTFGDAAVRAASSPPVPSLAATTAILIDADTGKVLYAKDADARRPMASTTKIMTALVALDHLSLDKKVTASARAEATNESQMFLKRGDVLTVRQLLHALLIKSANDGAVALAEASAGSVEAFADQMNQKAKELGLTHTHFTNPHGLDAKGHYTSARDLAMLARYAMQKKEIRLIVDTWQYTLSWFGHPAGETYTNHNSLIGKVGWVNGVKTGYTRSAGFCLVASGTKNGVNLISVVRGERTSAVCAREAQALLEYGFGLFRQETLAEPGAVVASLPVPYRGEDLALVPSEPLMVSVMKDEKVERAIQVKEEIQLPVEKGDVYGTVKFAVGGRVVGSVALVAATAVERPTLDTIVSSWRETLPKALVGFEPETNRLVRPG